MADDTLTGAGLVEAGARAAWVYRSGGDPAAWPLTHHPGAAAMCETERERVRAALRAAVEAAGVDARDLRNAAYGCAENYDDCVAALLRALAEVVEAGDG